MKDEQRPVRIIVEVVSHADVKRLEGRDDEIRDELSKLEGKFDGLHRTLYEVIEALGNLRGKR